MSQLREDWETLKKGVKKESKNSGESQFKPLSYEKLVNLKERVKRREEVVKNLDKKLDAKREELKKYERKLAHKAHKLEEREGRLERREKEVKERGEEKKETGKEAEKEKGKKEVKCAFCQGTGKKYSGVINYKAPCPVCKGEGSIVMEKPFQTCPHCEGKGRIKKRACPVCGGKGVVKA